MNVVADVAVDAVTVDVPVVLLALVLVLVRCHHFCAFIVKCAPLFVICLHLLLNPPLFHRHSRECMLQFSSPIHY